MCTARLASRVRAAHPVGIARLPGYKLAWHKRSKDGSGKCDAFRTGDPADMVVGVVYEIADGEKPRLDRAEGLGHGYLEKTDVVDGPSGPLQVSFYIAERSQIDSTLKPYDWYKEHVLCGAQDNQLPLDYIAQVTAVEALTDHDAARAHKERSVRATHRTPPA